MYAWKRNSSGVNVTVRVDGHVPIEKFLRYNAPKIVNAAQVSALNKCSGRIRSSTTKNVAKKLELAQKHLRPLIWTTRATRARRTAGVYFKTRSILAATWALPGAPVWNKEMEGARAGKKTFPGTFVAVPTFGRNVGVESIYRRKGRGRLPIDRERVRLTGYADVLTVTGHVIVERDLRNLFLHEMKWRKDKATAAAAAGGASS